VDLQIRGRVALVAAASRGLGRAIADELAAEGTALVICSRNQNEIETAAKEISRAHGVEVAGVAADVTKPGDVDALVRQSQNRFGQIDILVTNAGGPPPGTFESHPPERWQQAFELTFASVVNLVRGVLPGMKERRWGRIVCVTSIAAKQPVDSLILSNSMRPAVTGFARTLANEVATTGITVNCIIPGFTRTERVEQIAESNARAGGTTVEQIRAKWEQEIPMRRLGEPREFAALAAFLASERASYITAQSFAVDGGWIRALL
jgi:3-oxoacyl-[acyl-carrier protein] reductase